MSSQRRGWAPIHAVLRTHWPFLILLLVGLALRLALLLAYQPAFVSHPDTWGYVKGAAEELFVPDVRRPAGYAVFLRLLHAVSASVQLVIVVQHLLGLLSGLLVYVITFRATQSRWLSLIPAAVAVLVIDLIYLEHQLLSETTFTVLLLTAVLLLQRGSSATSFRHSLRWLVLAGLVLGAAVTVRTAGLFALLPAIVITPISMVGPVRRRIAQTSALATSAGAVLLVYMIAQHSVTGFFGLVPGSGWNLYMRAAPFAECQYFEEPKGTDVLCEASNPRDRFGGDFYGWDTRSPARRLGLHHLDAAPILNKWAIAAITQTPRAYLREIGKDLWHYVDPYGKNQRPRGGGTPDDMALDTRWPPDERLNRSVIEPYYGDLRVSTDDDVVPVLTSAQHVIRMHGPLMLLALLLSTLGLVVGTGLVRSTVAYLSGVGFVIPIVSVLTVIWGWRYAVSVQPAMAASGAIGAHAVAVHLRQLRAGRNSRVRPSTEDCPVTAPQNYVED